MICANLDLCSNCYMDDLHDVTHAFRRKISRDSQWYVAKELSIPEKFCFMTRCLLVSCETRRSGISFPIFFCIL